MSLVLMALVICQALFMPPRVHALLGGAQHLAGLSDPLASAKDRLTTDSKELHVKGHLELAGQPAIKLDEIYAYHQGLINSPSFYHADTDEGAVGADDKSPELRGYKRIYFGGLLIFFGLVAAASLIRKQIDFGDEVNEELDRLGYELDDSAPLKTRHAMENLDMIATAVGIVLFGSLCFAWGLLMRAKSKQEAVLWFLRQMKKESGDNFNWGAEIGEEQVATTTEEHKLM